MNVEINQIRLSTSGALYRGGQLVLTLRWSIECLRSRCQVRGGFRVEGSEWRDQSEGFSKSAVRGSPTTLRGRIDQKE